MYIQRAQEETGEGDEGESGENFTFALGIAGQMVSISYHDIFSSAFLLPKYLLRPFVLPFLSLFYAVSIASESETSRKLILIKY